MCIDSKVLNIKIIVNAYPIPYIDNILDYSESLAMFNKINFAQGYH